ncbi:MAG: acylneuraminate cytidylyltransferase family protein [Paracoccaceae bacterium]|nr:acylneuraminate cytidylyltransferase family protein [Paracoccaceae bacterium]MDG2258374.1 acylneuraminate cytidylyltransferase family protein [Paracoccaceae bacterium]
MTTAAIILARGGSKSIPGKNIMDFCGKPLLAWSILQVKHAQLVDLVVVSSDDKDILSVARAYGAKPIRRPDEFATDIATSEGALLHALDVLEAELDEDLERVVFLQPTSPLRHSSDLDGAVQAFDKAGADSLFSDAILDDFCVWTNETGELTGKTFDPWNRGRRQDREVLYLETGSIYVFKPDLLRKTGNRLGGHIARFTMPFWKSYEIDTLEDIAVCEFFFKKHKLDTQFDQN